MRRGVVIAAVLAGALVAATPAGAASVRSYSNVTVNGGKGFGGRSTLLVKVVGNVTCATGHGVVRSWYRRIDAEKWLSAFGLSAFVVLW
jgi:hypothetical protein